MVEHYFDVISGLKQTWAQFRDKELFKWAIAGMVGGIVILAAMVVGFLLSIKILIDAPGAGILLTLLVLAVGIIACVAFSSYIMPRFIRRAMKLQNIPVAKNPPSIKDYFILMLHVWFVNAFCWYSKKLLIPAAVLLAIGGIMFVFGLAMGASGATLIILSLAPFFLGAIAWSVAYTIYRERTKFAVHMFLRGDGPRGQMPTKSYCLVLGQTFEVFLAGFLGGVPLKVVAFIFELVGRGVLYLFMIPAMVVSGVSKASASNAGAPDFGTLWPLLLVGFALYMVIVLVWALIESCFWQAYLAGMFKYFDKAGPVKRKKPAKKKR